MDLRVAYLAGSPGTLRSHFGSGSRVHWDACLAPTHLAPRVGWVPAASWSKASWWSRPTSSRPGSCGNMACAISTMAVLHVIFTIATSQCGMATTNLGTSRKPSCSSPLEGHGPFAWVTFFAPANVFMPGGTRDLILISKLSGGLNGRAGSFCIAYTCVGLTHLVRVLCQGLT